MNFLKALDKAIQHPERVLPALVRKINPRSTWGSTIKPMGDFFSFTLEGFAAADNIPALLARTYYEQWYIRKVLKGTHVNKSLEIGCGFGRLSPTFAEFSREHLAIDINPDALSYGKKNFPHVTFLQASGTELPFPDHSFDLVVTWTVLQHIPKGHFEKAMTEIRRVLRPNGKALLCEATGIDNLESDIPLRHTFKRPKEVFQSFLAPMKLSYCSAIDELVGSKELPVPGPVMLFE